MASAVELSRFSTPRTNENTEVKVLIIVTQICTREKENLFQGFVFSTGRSVLALQEALSINKELIQEKHTTVCKDAFPALSILPVTFFSITNYRFYLNRPSLKISSRKL